jgi:hypothetical protein
MSLERTMPSDSQRLGAACRLPALSGFLREHKQPVELMTSLKRERWRKTESRALKVRVVRWQIRLRCGSWFGMLRRACGQQGQRGREGREGLSSPSPDHRIANLSSGCWGSG